MTTRSYTPEELQERQERLAQVRSFDDLPKLFQPSQPVQPARGSVSFAKTAPDASYSRVMVARYDGRCATCGGSIRAGDTIHYDGKAHHEPKCPTTTTILDGPEASTATQPTLPSIESASSTVSVISDGRYTIVSRDGERRLTLRVSTARDSSTLAGKRIISYLYGPDNDSDYRGFAFLTDSGRVQVWKRYSADSHLIQAAQFLVQPGNAAEAGYAYALASSRCYRCGHTLTVPASIHRGLGPDCARQVEG